MATFNPFMQQVPAEMQLPDYLPIQRQRQMAQMLMQQGMTPQQGQMVSGHYVAPSITQYLAQGLSGYLGAKGVNEADEKTKALAEQLKAQGQTDISNFMSAAQGTPGETIPPTTQVDDQGNPMPSAQMPATPPDLGKALQIGMGSNVPALQQASSGIFSQAFIPKVPKWEKVEMPMPDGSTRVGFVNTNSPNPMSTFQLGGAAPVKGVVADGQLLNPVSGTRIGQGIPNPNKPFNPDGTPNPAYQSYEQMLRKSGQPITTAVTNVQNFEPFANKVQGEMGTALVKNYETLQSAPQTLMALDNAKQYLAKAGPFVGSGAETKLGLAKFFNNNFGTNINPDAVKNAEALQSSLFYNVMDNLKKMDASPSQQQQKVMQDAFGRLTTDPGALPLIIDTYKGIIQSKVAQHNARVQQASQGPAGIKFPYDITVKLPQAEPQVQQGGVKFLGFE